MRKELVFGIAIEILGNGVGIGLQMTGYINPLWGWIIIGASTLSGLILILYGVCKKPEDYEAKNKHKNNWILDYELKNGKLPVLPSYLRDIVPDYRQGQPISRNLQLIPMAGQFWHDLTPQQRKKLKIFVEWLGRDFDEYLGGLRKIFPNISLDIAD